MAKTGSTTATSLLSFGGRKGAATPPHRDVTAINAKGEVVVVAYKPGDTNVKQMAASTWAPRHLRRAH